MLFNRFIVINLVVSNGDTVSTITVSSQRVHCGFDIHKTLVGEGENGARIWFYNPDAKTIEILNSECIGYSRVDVYAGYVEDGNIQKIYTGDIISSRVSNEQGSVLLEIESMIGFNLSHTGTTSLSWGKNTGIDTIVNTIDRLGLFTIIGADSVDNITLDKVDIKLDKLEDMPRKFNRGLVCDGNVKDFLMNLLDRAGYKVIDSGDEIEIFSHKSWTTRTIKRIVLNSKTGLIGIPEMITDSEEGIDEELTVGEKKRSGIEPSVKKPKVGYRVTSLLNPSARIGHSIILSSSVLKFDNLTMKVESVNHIGSNHDNDYYTIMEGYIYDKLE